MIGPLFVMAGPTIGRDDIYDTMGEDGGEVVLLPPASQGDVYAATRFRPWAIGIVDGYFERVPAVWHKEILWAMSQGVRVYGAASMGASTGQFALQQSAHFGDRHPAIAQFSDSGADNGDRIADYLGAL